MKFVSRSYCDKSVNVSFTITYCVTVLIIVPFLGHFGILEKLCNVRITLHDTLLSQFIMLQDHDKNKGKSNPFNYRRY